MSHGAMSPHAASLGVTNVMLIDGRVPYDMAIWGEHFKRSEYHRRHHVRYKRFVETPGNGFPCQECKGRGGWVEPVLDYGQGPWFDCGFCEGTGLVTRWGRGWWLRWKAIEKANMQARREAAKAKRAVTSAASAAQK